MLAALEALERARATVATKLRRRAMEKPAAREAIEQANRKAQATIELHAERVRHRLLLDDSILSTYGVRPWQQDRNSPLLPSGRDASAVLADENLRSAHTRRRQSRLSHDGHVVREAHQELRARRRWV